MTQGKTKGFTLIELMIVVVVVAILAAIGIPSYVDYVRRGKITEAVSSLSELRLRAEKFFSDNRTYQNAGATDVGFNEIITDAKYFTFNCTAANASTFTCTATGIEGLAGFSYTINQSNEKGSSFTQAGWTTCTTKWILKKGEAC